jgi:hypothetical protein
MAGLIKTTGIKAKDLYEETKKFGVNTLRAVGHGAEMLEMTMRTSKEETKQETQKELLDLAQRGIKLATDIRVWLKSTRLEIEKEVNEDYPDKTETNKQIIVDERLEAIKAKLDI